LASLTILEHFRFTCILVFTKECLTFIFRPYLWFVGSHR